MSASRRIGSASCPLPHTVCRSPTTGAAQVERERETERPREGAFELHPVANAPSTHLRVECRQRPTRLNGPMTRKARVPIGKRGSNVLLALRYRGYGKLLDRGIECALARSGVVPSPLVNGCTMGGFSSQGK